MRSIRVAFANGNSLETNINGTDAEIRAYYIGQWFDMGSGDVERMTQATRVEFLDEPESLAGEHPGFCVQCLVRLPGLGGQLCTACALKLEARNAA